ADEAGAGDADARRPQAGRGHVPGAGPAGDCRRWIRGRAAHGRAQGRRGRRRRVRRPRRPEGRQEVTIMHRDYYAVLGIASTAAPREIRQAYRRLARQYSPDVNLWDVQARSLFDEIAEAYRVLSDPTARGMYDRFGHQVTAGVIDPSRRGDDVHVAVDLSFAE